MALPIIAPSGLTYTQAGTIFPSVDAFTDSQWSDAFLTNTIANYTPYTGSPFSGSSTVTIGSGACVFSGASAGGEGLRPTGQLLIAPYTYIEIIVSAQSNVNTSTPFCGFMQDANNRVWAAVVDGALLIDTVNNSSSASTSSFGSFSPPYKLCCVLSFPEVWAWVDTGSGYAPIAQITLASTATGGAGDLRLLTKFSASWLPVFGSDRDAGATTTVTSARVGYVGGAPGIRDAKPVTYANGRPYLSNDGHQLYTATVGTTDSFDGNHMVVLKLDLSTPTVPVLSIVSHLFYKVASGDLSNPATTKDTCTALYGGQMVRNLADTGWTVITNGWGYQNILTDGIDLFNASLTTSANLLTGAHALDAYLVTVSGTSKSVYDNGFRYSGSTIDMVASETVDRLLSPSNNYHLCYITGPDPDNLTFVRHDTSVDHVEQATYCKVGGSWYVFAGGDGGPSVWDADIQNDLGSINGNVDFGSASVAFPPCGFCPQAVTYGSTTRYPALAWTDDTLTVNGNNCIATLGRLYTAQSQAISGIEWADAMTFIFNNGSIQLQGGSIDYVSDTIKCRLVDAAVTPDINDTAMTGYTAIGTDATVSGKTVTNNMTLNRTVYGAANPTIVNSSSGTNYGSAVVYKVGADDAHSIPLFCLALTSTDPAGINVLVAFDNGGVGWTQQ